MEDREYISFLVYFRQIHYPLETNTYVSLENGGKDRTVDDSSLCPIAQTHPLLRFCCKSFRPVYYMFFLNK